jgi:hypothetical protein
MWAHVVSDGSARYQEQSSQDQNSAVSVTLHIAQHDALKDEINAPPLLDADLQRGRAKSKKSFPACRSMARLDPLLDTVTKIIRHLPGPFQRENVYSHRYDNWTRWKRKCVSVVHESKHVTSNLRTVYTRDKQETHTG